MKKLFVLIVLAILVVVEINKNEYIFVPNSSIRIRVIANSNSQKDQRDKQIVKDSLNSKMAILLKDKTEYSEVDDTIKLNETYLDNSVSKTLKENNIDTDYKINYGENYFPEKEYDGIIYEAGNYKSYVVTLGKGKGENFWCVLFPPLCNIPENTPKYEYHSLVKDIIDNYK